MSLRLRGAAAVGEFPAMELSDRSRWLARHIVPHERELRNWLRRDGVPHDQIDDIVQETYAKLAALPSVEHVERPWNYMFQTARSIRLLQLRRERVVRFDSLPAEDNVFESREESPEAMAILRDDLRHADRLLAQLPERVREAFIMRRVEGLSQREIAAKMHVSENTVEKHIGKALRRIMQLFAEGSGGNDNLDASDASTGPTVKDDDRSGKPRGR